MKKLALLMVAVFAMAFVSCDTKSGSGSEASASEASTENVENANKTTEETPVATEESKTTEEGKTVENAQ